MIPEVALGSVVAASIAALLSFLGLIASKELKTSEFRQAWIDAVREDVAGLIAAASKLDAVIFYADDHERIQTKRDCLEAMNVAVGRLKLRLNPKEDLTKELMKHINDAGAYISKYVKDKKEEDYKLFHKSANDLSDCAGKILKIEWKRVKAGEPIFRIAKWAAFVVMITAISTAADYYIFVHRH